MEISVNGESIPFSEPVSIAAFLSLKEINPETVVVELNREIVSTPQYDDILLKDKDILEILRFVGGG